MLDIIYSRYEEYPSRENLRDHLYNSVEDDEDSQIIYQQNGLRQIGQPSVQIQPPFTCKRSKLKLILIS